MTELLVTLVRPDAATRLGMRLQSEAAGLAAQVISLTPDSVAARAGVRVGDFVLRVDGQLAADADAATELVGGIGVEASLSLLRTFRKVVLQRNELGLGLAVDAHNCITALYEGAAAAEHGGLAVGDRIVAVDGVKLASTEALAPRIPKGKKMVMLTLIGEGGEGFSSPPQSPDESSDSYSDTESSEQSRASAGQAARAMPTSIGPRADTGTTDIGSPSTSVPLSARVPDARVPDARVPDASRSASGPFSVAERKELRKAFDLLVGEVDPGASISVPDDMGGRVLPGELHAVLYHFDKAATFEDAVSLCQACIGSHSGELSLDFEGFCDAMVLISKQMEDPKFTLWGKFDTNGLGVVTPEDVMRRLKERGLSRRVKHTQDDLACMLQTLSPPSGGVYTRGIFFRDIGDMLARSLSGAGFK